MITQKLEDFTLMMNMNNMMKQLQKMQKEMAKKMEQVQEELENETVEASAGGDMVTVVMNGHNEIKELNISKEVVDPDDVEMLQDLIIAAVNEASRKATEIREKKMGDASGMNIPGLGNLGGLF
jgi:hypothetical protein